MKHLIKFESLHKEIVLGDHYQFIPHDKFYSWVESQIQTNIPEDEVEFIKNRYDIKGNYIQCSTRSDDNKIIIYSHKYNFTIRKYNDEWYSLLPIPIYGTMVHNLTRNYKYICDQFDGLIKLLDEFNDKNRLNYRPKWKPWSTEDTKLGLHD